MPLRHWLQLALTTGIGPVLIRRIIDKAGSPEAACAATASLLRTVDGIGTNKASTVAEALKIAGTEVDRELARAASAGATIICPDDPSYPTLLRDIPDPPAVLYLRGDLQDRDLHAVGIVGSRKCSIYGREQAERFGALLAGAGVTVISGGARGIDSAAHRGAMQPLNGRTVAVLGCGVDVVYPPENASLFQQIAAGDRGAVISEYPMGTPPLADNFPRRNRIISGMSRGVLVIEADVRSGALITARQAIDDHGRTVFALPGRVDSPTSAGAHQLIREGATLVTNLEEILSELGPLPATASEPSDPLFDKAPDQGRETKVTLSLDDAQASIIEALKDNELDAESIIEQTSLQAGVVMRELTMLSLKGLIRRIDGNKYAAAARRART
jgi:DNA processing protein